MKKLFIAACMIGVLASCKKNETVTPAVVTKKDQIVANSWKISKVEIVVDGQTTDATSNLINDCNLDDFDTYSTDGKWVTDGGTTKCTDTDPQTIASTWSIDAAETQLTRVEDGDTNVYKIEALSSTGFTLSAVESLFGIKTTVKYIYVKK